MVLQIRNKKGMTAGYFALGVLVVGGVVYMATSDKVSLPTQNVVVDNNIDMPDFYVSTLTADNSSVYTITTTGSGSSTEYMIEVDADNLGNSARTDTFQVGVMNDLAGRAYDNNLRFPQEVFVPFSSDVIMKDTSDDSHTILQHSSSTFDSKKTSQVLDLAGVTEQVKTLSVSINPNSADLGTLTEINDVGEFKILNWDFGQSNKITLKIKE